jgi:hypothetical protein
MRRFWTVGVLSAALASLAPAAANAVSISFTSTLNGAQENPPVNTPATGTGTGTLTGEPGSFVFSYEVSYSGLRGGLVAPLAHIHSGARDINGPILHDLDNASSFIGTTEGTIQGDWRFDDPTSPLIDGFAQELLNGALYFNIHSEFSPSGEIRGQIEEVPEPSSVLGVLVLGALGASQLKKQRRRKSASGVTSVSK